MKNDQIISGASSYVNFNKGIEIEIDTHPNYRKQSLATIVASKLIIECLNKGLYPNWDAHNLESLNLAIKLGYCLDKAYEVSIINSL